MTRVNELRPGDQVEIIKGSGNVATFLARTDHPLYAGFQLVIWKMPKSSVLQWSHDALSPFQDVGEVMPSTPESRETAVREALHGRGQ